jgi:anti-anti-sigma factor
MKLKRTGSILRLSEKQSMRTNAAASGPIIRRKCVDFAVTARTMDDVAVVACEGSLVLQKQADALCRVVSGLVLRYRNVVLNLEGVKAIDGKGLGILAQCIRDAREARVNLVLCGVPAKVRELLDLTQISSLVAIADSEAEAVETSRTAA